MQEIHKIEDLPPTFEQIVESVESLREESIKMLQELVEIESKLGNESAVQNYMENLFVNMKLKTHRWTIIKDDIKDLPGFSPVNWKYDNKECVVGTHFPKFAEKGKSLILNGHLDVVPEGPKEMWTEDPFKSYVKDGRVYGRGSGDMKAGVVCFVMAFKALQKLGYHPGSRIHMQSVIEEECSGNGTLSCCQKGYGADACIIPEPFGDTIVTAQPGVMWLNVEVNGKPVHVLDTSAGVNAIHAAYAIYQDLQKLEEEWNEPNNRHPSYPVESFKHPINFNLGLINGGDWASTVPTKCEFGIRIGFFPGRKLSEVREEIEKRISESAKRIGVTHKLTWNGFQAEGCVMDPNGDMMKLLGKNFEKVTKNPPSFKPITATTDARFFQLYYDIPATCLGPEATNIHGIDESVSIESMMDTTKTLATFISEWCGLEKMIVFKN